MVPPSFTALAVAARRANAVGVVRLTLQDDGLALELTRTGGFTPGFALASIAEPARIVVPYSAVRGLVRERALLHLAIDPRAATPHNRFALACFSKDADPLAPFASLRPLHWRSIARAASFALPLPIALATALLPPDRLAAGVIGRAAIALVAGLAAIAVSRAIAEVVTWGGPRANEARDAFEALLAVRLGLAPARSAAWEERMIPPAAAGDRGASLLPIAGVALGAVIVIALFGLGKSLIVPRTPPPSIEVARAVRGVGAAARKRADLAPIVEERPPAPPRCVCDRASSPLWKEGPSSLSVLFTERDSDAPAGKTPPPAVTRGGRPEMRFDVYAVNNAAAPKHDVRVTLTFARRNKRGARVGAVDRGLFWGGALAPGAAVKWRVRAPGTEVRVDVAYTDRGKERVLGTKRETLADAGLGPAPADAFADLASRLSPLRAHAALMLAYARDPRALTFASELSADKPSEALAADLKAIVRASQPVFACDVARRGGELTACVQNETTRIKTGLSLRLLPSGTTLPLPVAIPVHDGVRVAIPIDDADVDEIEVNEPAKDP